MFYRGVDGGLLHFFLGHELGFKVLTAAIP